MSIMCIYIYISPEKNVEASGEDHQTYWNIPNWAQKIQHPNPHLLFQILSWGHSTDPFLCGERNHDLGAQKFLSSSGSGWKAVIAKLAHGIALHLSAIRIHCISFIFILCPFPFHPVVHHMCLWHCLNCLQHLQTTYFARQSEVVKAIGHWPWREAHHLNWWSILFTCRRRKLWSARCKCHCNTGNASPTCICDSSVPHDWAPSGCCRHTGASYYYYLSCLPQLHTKDKCPMLFWGWSLVSNTSTRRLLQHVTMWISLPRSPFCSPMQASRSYYHHLRDKSLDSMDSMDRKISCHTPHKHIYAF